MSGDGVKPDITVEVDPQQERSYYVDAFKEIPRTNLLIGGGLALTNQTGGTNPIARKNRYNEAELVRERKEGASLDSDVPAGRFEPETPTVQDPALARALDVLKGLALVRQSRS